MNEVFSYPMVVILAIFERIYYCRILWSQDARSLHSPSYQMNGISSHDYQPRH
jgi:hypothetical protein